MTSDIGRSEEAGQCCSRKMEIIVMTVHCFNLQDQEDEEKQAKSSGTFGLWPLTARLHTVVSVCQLCFLNANQVGFTVFALRKGSIASVMLDNIQLSFSCCLTPSTTATPTQGRWFKSAGSWTCPVPM